MPTDSVLSSNGGSLRKLQEAENILLCGVHDIVIPPIACSFEWRKHPDYKQLAEMSDAWVLANFTNISQQGSVEERPPTFTITADHLIKSAFHLLVVLCYAHGIAKRMYPIVKMMAWFFMIDNILDDPTEMGADLDRANHMVDTVLTVFHGTYVYPCPSPTRLVCILTDTAAEWWSEMCVGMPSKQKARLSHAFNEYLDASRIHILYRNSRQLPNLDTLLKVRARNVGWRPCAVLIEHSQGFELDDEALSHPLLMKLQEQVEQHVFMVNDIISFKREYLQGDFCNIVSVLYFRKMYDPNVGSNSAPTLQGAVLEAVQMIKERDDECVRLMEEIKRCEQLMKKSGMVEYLDGLGLWLSGSLYWHLVSGRYGNISATANVHTTPPDILAPHHLHLEANKGVSHIVPYGIHMMGTNSLLDSCSE